jgi:hypothetical protein
MNYDNIIRQIALMVIYDNVLKYKDLEYLEHGLSGIKCYNTSLNQVSNSLLNMSAEITEIVQQLQPMLAETALISTDYNIPITNSIISQVDDFMQSTDINKWLSDGILRIYVRKGTRYINNNYIDTFDIGSILDINPTYEHQGYFKMFMRKVESIGIPVYVEHIQNTNITFIDLLRKNGYTILKSKRNTTAVKDIYQ